MTTELLTKQSDGDDGLEVVMEDERRRLYLTGRVRVGKQRFTALIQSRVKHNELQDGMTA